MSLTLSCNSPSRRYWQLTVQYVLFIALSGGTHVHLHCLCSASRVVETCVQHEDSNIVSNKWVQAVVPDSVVLSRALRRLSSCAINVGSTSPFSSARFLPSLSTSELLSSQVLVGESNLRLTRLSEY